MKARGRLAGLICAVAASLALPAGAEAKPGPEVFPGSFRLEIGLPESNGYEMSIAAGDHRQIYLVAEKGATAVVYRVTGRASSRRLEADFGPLGRIDVRMSLEPSPLLPPFLRRGRRGAEERCRGKDPVELSGRFHGTVDFPGEPNIAGARTRSGHAVVERSFRKVCKPRPSNPSQGKKKPRGKKPQRKKGGGGFELGAALLAARAHGGGRTTSLDAIALTIDSEVLFGIVAGSVHERLDQVRIIRSAAELVEESELKLGPEGRKTESARLTPSPPFTGTARYFKRIGSPATWTGNLAVRLPGAGNVPLAGPGFSTAFCQTTSVDVLRRCAQEVQSLSTLRGGLASRALGLYGSGSHSQPLALARLSSLR